MKYIEMIANFFLKATDYLRYFQTQLHLLACKVLLVPCVLLLILSIVEGEMILMIASVIVIGILYFDYKDCLYQLFIMKKNLHNNDIRHDRQHSDQ